MGAGRPAGRPLVGRDHGFEGEGPELAQLIREILGVVENDPELAGFEIQTARHV